MMTTGDPAGRPEGAAEYHRFSKDVEVMYGRGSFWLMGSEDAEEATDHLRARFRQKTCAAGRAKTAPPSPYAAHYLFERHVMVLLPLLHEASGEVVWHTVSLRGSDGQIALVISSHWLRTKFTPPTRIRTVVTFLGFLSAMRRHMEEGKIYAGIVEKNLKLQVPRSHFSLLLDVPVGCTLLFEVDSGLSMCPGVTFHIRGGVERRSLLTSASVGGYCAGVTVKARGTLLVDGATISFTGSSLRRRHSGTGSYIMYALQALTAAGRNVATGELGATVVLNNSAFLNSACPIFSAGSGARVVIADSLFQDVAQAGECVDCEVHLERVHVLGVPYESRSLKRGGSYNVYVDGDNDGLYLRDGVATLRHVIVANTLDDCVDSSSSAPKTTVDGAEIVVSGLTKDGSVLKNCLHEGIALGSSTGTFREVVVRSSVVSDAQQGVENGYSASGHRVIVTGVLIRRTQVAVRHGDAYPLLARGRVCVEGDVFVNNTFDVLDEAFLLSDAKMGWRNLFLKDHTDGSLLITFSICTSRRQHRKADSRTFLPQLSWWRLGWGRGGGGYVSNGSDGGPLSPILYGRTHYRV